jgi:hypothetical protein
MTIPGLTRPTLITRSRRSVLLATTGVAAALGAGVAVVARPSEPHEVVPIPIVTPVSIRVPPAPAPTVVVQPAPPPPPPLPLAPRALKPVLDPGCVVPSQAVMEGTSTEPTDAGTCGWDNGFPAIARDGSLVAVLWHPDTGQRETYELAVDFIDADTSRVVRHSIVVTDDELAVKHLDRVRLQRIVNRRVAAIQRTLDAGTYRSLLPLGSAGGYDGVESKPLDPRPTTPYAEISYNQVRIIDPATSTVLGRVSVGMVEAPHPDTSEADAEAGRDDTCHGWTLWRMTVSWDPATRVVLADQSYRTGGSCMCPDISAVRVARIP